VNPRKKLTAWLSATIVITGMVIIGSPVAHATGLTYDATGGGAKCANCTTLSWSHTDAGNALLVGVSVGKNGDAGLTAVATYNGTAMTLLKTVHTNNQTAGFLDVFGLVNPATGTHNVVVTETGGTASEITGGSESFSGAAATGTFGTAASAVGSSATASVTAGSTSGNIVAGFVANGSQVTSATSPSISRDIANQDNNTGAGNSAGATSLSTGSNVTMAWTVVNDWWAAVAVEVKTSPVQAPPTVITQAATGIAVTGATLNGTVNPNGAATTYRFEYGTTTSYGTLVPVPDGSSGSGTTAVAENASLTGLTASTTYHYRLDATNSGGTANGVDQQFTTNAATILTNRPAQSFSLAYNGPGQSNAAEAYAQPGGLVVTGQGNYGDQVFKDISAAGGTVLVYLDPLLNETGAGATYQNLLNNASACGAAVPLWPGNFHANDSGYLNDFRVGGIEQSKLHCVLEQMVTDNPEMGGFFVDDIGSRSWYPGFSWNTFPDQQGYRDGAIALTQTYRQVADEHGLIFIVNGSWNAGTLSAQGGGYPDMNQPGNALADGGYVEHHDGQISYFGPYGCSTQWASQSSVTHGTAFMIAGMATSAGVTEYTNSNCYAYVQQQTDYSVIAPPLGPFHPTGLPSKVTK
jgi:hypothetical protein